MSEAELGFVMLQGEERKTRKSSSSYHRLHSENFYDQRLATIGDAFVIFYFFFARQQKPKILLTLMSSLSAFNDIVIHRVGMCHFHTDGSLKASKKLFIEKLCG
jgi:hypothetical protein